MGLLESALDLRGVLVVERHLIPHREQVGLPDEAARALQVDEAVHTLADGGAQAPIELGVHPLEVLGHVVPYEYGVEPQNVPFAHGLPAHLVLGEVHAPDVEGIYDPAPLVR